MLYNVFSINYLTPILSCDWDELHARETRNGMKILTLHLIGSEEQTRDESNRQEFKDSKLHGEVTLKGVIFGES